MHIIHQLLPIPSLLLLLMQQMKQRLKSHNRATEVLEAVRDLPKTLQNRDLNSLVETAKIDDLGETVESFHLSGFGHVLD
jgi:hypothetical protein